MHYRQGARDFSEVFQLQIELMDAKLNVAESLDDKVDVLRSQLAVAKGSHVIALDRYQGGAGSELDVVRAKSLVLHIEIELLKLKRALGNQVDIQH
jgi:hypothetical protein